MIVTMAMITSTDSYTKNNKIELYLHFEKTRERRFEFGAVEENQNHVLFAIWSIHESSQNPVTT